MVFLIVVWRIFFRGKSSGKLPDFVLVTPMLCPPIAYATKTSHLRPEDRQRLEAAAHRICDHEIANVTPPRGGVSGAGSFGPHVPPLRSSVFWP